MAAQKPAELSVAVEENLRCCGADWIDVVNLRPMSLTPGLIAEADQIVQFKDQLAEMVTLRDEGKILGIGLSHITIEQLRTALPLVIACVQNVDNLIHRGDELMLAVCQKNGVARVPYFPLGEGYGTLPKVIDEPAVQDAAARMSVTASQVGLAWQLTHSPNIMIITGTSSSNDLNENVAAGDVYLDHDALAELDRVTAEDTVGRPAA
jgi:pyridoxine 4-dehydrogenase